MFYILYFLLGVEQKVINYINYDSVHDKNR